VGSARPIIPGDVTIGISIEVLKEEHVKVILKTLSEVESCFTLRNSQERVPDILVIEPLSLVDNVIRINIHDSDFILGVSRGETSNSNFVCGLVEIKCSYHFDVSWPLSFGGAHTI
jgi:hypothetical protein